MPRTTREWALRKLESSYGCLQKSQEHLLELGQRYYVGGHPEYGEACAAITMLMDNLLYSMRPLWLELGAKPPSNVKDENGGE